MRIFVTGTRGIPAIPGGVEKHCEELYPRIAARGHDVTVCTRASYVREKTAEWRGVRLAHCYAPHRKSMEAIVHTYRALIMAYPLRPDIVHIHGIGPSLLAPLARLLGYRVVVTNHGPDYDRQKWGFAAKTMLRLGERLGGLFAHEIIAISSVVAGIVKRRCRRETVAIPNGVPLPSLDLSRDFLSTIGVAENEYILTVARFVPEKGLHDLIAAFSASAGALRLVIAGDADHETEYSRSLRKMAAADPRIVLTGYITGEPLRQVYVNARLFVLPSSHEGLPIALLEAMSYGLSALVSDIPANKEVGLPADRYFQCGDVADLKEKMSLLLATDVSPAERERLREHIQAEYNWDDIADRTIEVYRSALKTTGPRRRMISETMVSGAPENK